MPNIKPIQIQFDGLSNFLALASIYIQTPKNKPINSQTNISFIIWIIPISIVLSIVLMLGGPVWTLSQLVLTFEKAIWRNSRIGVSMTNNETAYFCTAG